jgi:microcystin-dependent protein
MYGGSAAPGGWLLCRGQPVSRTAFPALFSIISTFYGSGDGVSTFNVPNLRAKVPVGLDDTGTNTWAATLGQTGGEATHLLLLAEMAAHAHTITASQGSHTHTDSGHGHTDSGHQHVFQYQGPFVAGSNYATGSGWALAFGSAVQTQIGYANIQTGHANISTVSAGPITATAASAGGGGAHNNLQPYVVLNYIIKT